MRFKSFTYSAVLLLAPALFAQLNDHCTVSILNRTAQVKADGSWHIDNVPFTNEVLRARSTCVEGGLTRLGQSKLFRVGLDLKVGVDAAFNSAVTPIPTAVRLTAAATKLTTPNQTVPLTVTGTFAGNSTQDLTKASTGTTYFISNPSLATISQDGVVTAKATGNVLVQATNEGAQGLIQLSIVLSGDSDGDGIPDDVEIAQGLDPNNPADALDDADHDGLTNLEEFRVGTDMHNPDTDGDGLSDGQEVKVLHTNPLLKDTDGDGVPDNIEVATGSDPTNPSSFNLAAALSGIHVSPASFALDIVAVGGNVSFQQLQVTGDFKLGGTIDITAKSKGTTYTSSNLTACNFGAEDGRVFAVAGGSCVITVTNGVFTATANGVVSSSTPQALSLVTLPGYANDIDAVGDFAYVASGSAGLTVVNVANTANPTIVGSLDTPGNANSVRVIGKFAFVADGSTGLQVIDVSNPAAPVLAGALVTPGEALEVTMGGGSRAYIASGNSGLVVVDVSNPSNPTLITQIPTPGRARSVDLLHASNGKLYALVADDIRNPGPVTTPGIRVIDVTDISAATDVGTLSQAHLDFFEFFPQSIRTSGNFAFVVGRGPGGSGGPLLSVDLTNPLVPVLKSGVGPGQLRSRDLKVAGRNVIFPDTFDIWRAFRVDISNPASLGPPTVIDFRSLFTPEFVSSHAITAKGPLLFIAVARLIDEVTEKGTTSSSPTSLVLFQYLSPQDSLQVAPNVTLTDPQANSSVLGGSTIALRATATDDVAVGSVTFLVNGTDVFTDDSQPFEMLYSVPADATNLTITARATDFGGNVTTSPATTVTVVADPLTTLNGRVARSDGSAVTGAAIACFNKTATSDATGQFSIAGSPVANGAVSCSASLTENSRFLRGATVAFSPVPGSVTPIGVITVRDVPRVLLIADKPTQTTTSFTKVLRDANADVTVVPQATWDNTNPPLTNFDCVVHLNGGITPALVLQQALVSFVRAGGGYVGFAPNPANDTVVTSPFHELTLFPGDRTVQQPNSGFETYTKTPGQESHPVTAGLPTSFQVFTLELHRTSSTGFFPFTETPPVAIVGLSTPSGTPGVAVRQLGSGRVVRFAVAENVQDSAEVPDASLLKMLTNATQWASGR